MKKTCKTCNKSKQLTAFYPERLGKFGRRSRCISCYRTQAAEFRKNNSATVQAQARRRAKRWRGRNLDSARERGRISEQRRRGTRRTKILLKLGNRCCRCPVAEPSVLHVDHIHDDGWLDKELLSRNGVTYYDYILSNLTQFQLLCANCNHRKRIDALPGPQTKQGIYSARYTLKLRVAAVIELGSICRGCGENDQVVLCFDHKAGQGRFERKLLGNTAALYRDIVRRPNHYQLLCHNCNWLKRRREL